MAVRFVGLNVMPEPRLVLRMSSWRMQASPLLISAIGLPRFSYGSKALTTPLLSDSCAAAR